MADHPECVHTSVEGLTLRPLRPTDADAYHALLHQNQGHLGPDYASELAQRVTDHAGRFEQNPTPALMFGIRLRGALVGRIDLVAVQPPKYGMGYWLTRDATGHGFATAAVNAITTYARDAAKATEVYAGVRHGNDKSVAVLERAGFVRSSRFEDYDRYRLVLEPLPAEPSGHGAAT